MRGRPLLHWAIFCVCWAALLLPMLHVSSGPQKTDRTEQRDQSEPALRDSVWINLRFTEPPTRASITIDGEQIWSVQSPERNRIEELVEIGWPHGTSELEMTVEWPTAAHRAVALKLEPIDAAPVAVTRFSEGKIMREGITLER